MALSRINAKSIADGTIVASDIADGIVTNAKLAGSITSDKITSVSNTAIAGLIQAAQIGSVSNTALSGVVTASQLASTLDLTGKTVTLPAGTTNAGKVLQVVSTTKTDTFSTASTSFVDITGLSASITPLSASSKVLVMAYVAVGKSGAAVTMLNILRGSTAIAVGDARGSRSRATACVYWGGDDVVSQLDTVPLVFLDSPATTSATTYKIQIKAQSGGDTSYVNRDGADYDIASYGETVVSTITVMEIAA